MLEIIRGIGNALQTPLLLVIRLYLGYQFFFAGLGKFLKFSQVTEFFGNMGLPFPTFNAFLVASVESICGAMLFVGFFSRIAALLLICVMAVALAVAHPEVLTALLKFDSQPLMGSSAFQFLFGSFIICCFGPGKVSLDHWLKK